VCRLLQLPGMSFPNRPRPRRRSSSSAVFGMAVNSGSLSDCLLHSTLSLDISRNLGGRSCQVFGPTGHRTIAQGLCLFRVDSYGPKGQESLAQGLPWVIALTRISPEGATGCGRIGSEPLSRIAYASLAPSGPNVFIGLPRVNPGLGFLAPSGRVLGPYERR
jgi:hypothetical protein